MTRLLLDTYFFLLLYTWSTLVHRIEIGLDSLPVIPARLVLYLRRVPLQLMFQ
jgi:hypothetical protein